MTLYFSLGTDATKQLCGIEFDACYLQCLHLELWAVSQLCWCSWERASTMQKLLQSQTEFITLQQLKKAEDNV